MAESRTLSDLVRGHQKRPDRKETEHNIQRDQFVAARGDLIEKCVKSEFWTGAIYPAIELLYDEYHANMLNGDVQAMGGVKFAEDLVTMLGGFAQMGRKAIHRISERNFGKGNVLPFEEKRGEK
jgi:hypothetical protein